MKPRLTATSVIRSPRYYCHFFGRLAKQPYIFLFKKTLVNTVTRSGQFFFGQLVTVLTGYRGILFETLISPTTSASTPPCLSWSSPVKHEFKDIFQENGWCFYSTNPNLNALHRIILNNRCPTKRVCEQNMQVSCYSGKFRMHGSQFGGTNQTC